MDQNTKDSIKGWTGALLIMAAFLAVVYFSIDPIDRPFAPVNCPAYGAAGTVCVGR